VRFWDASALVPLCIEQPLSKRARELHDEDPELVVWWGSVVECASAIARLHREGGLTDAHEASARTLLSALRASWFELQPGDAMREQALRLLRLHPLRAADTLQLAAALEWAGSPPAEAFVSFDTRLRSAAQREGFPTP
jgi:predicted nucleic acid-binding protein